MFLEINIDLGCGHLFEGTGDATVTRTSLGDSCLLVRQASLDITCRLTKRNEFSTVSSFPQFTMPGNKPVDHTERAGILSLH